MAIAYVDAASTASWGIDLAGLGGTTITTSGISIDTIGEAFANPSEYLMDSQNRKIGKAINIDETHTVSISGEITGTVGTTGILGSLFATAVTLAGAEAAIGATLIATAGTFGIADTGDFYLENPSLDRSRGVWAKFSADFVRNPLITGNAS